jgi:ferredoxin
MHLDTAIVGPDRQEVRYAVRQTHYPSTLSIKDLPWQILWDKDKCTLCGRCTAVCPVNAIELGRFPQTPVAPAWGSWRPPANDLHLITASARKPIRPMPAWAAPCATWSAPTTPSCPCTATRPTSCASTSTAAASPAPGRAAQRSRQSAGPDQVHPHLHADRPGPGCRAARVRTAHPAGAGAAAGESLKFMAKTAGCRRSARSIP